VQAFALGGGGEPARECGRVAEVAKLVHQLQPDALAGVGGVGAGQPVPAADGPNQRGVPLDEGIPRLLVAASGARHQVGERPFAADQARLSGRDRVPPFRCWGSFLRSALCPRQLSNGAAAALVIPRMFRSATLRSPAFAERSGHRSRQVSGRTPDSTETHRPLLSHTA
jgi:hypothetical protein